MAGTWSTPSGSRRPGAAREDTGGRTLGTGSRPSRVPSRVPARPPSPRAGGGTAAVLIACSHGTTSPDGRRAIADLRARIAALRPGLRVVEAYVDVQRPGVADVVRRLVGRGQRCVVVPLLLSTGYHVRVDIAAAVAGTAGAAVAARPLGPDPVLADALRDRLSEAGIGPDDSVVLAAAGSSDAAGVAEVAQVTAALTDRLGRPVATGYLSAAQPSVDQAVSAALAGAATTPATATAPATAPADRARQVVVATYLLSPGYFADRLADQAAGAGARRITAPLAGHPALAELALRRYDEARRQWDGTAEPR